jgi:hypothetical protein
MQTMERAPGRRYIFAETNEYGAWWVLRIDGETVATAAMTNWHEPPFALTEGLDFTPQYESHEDEVEGIPTSWYYEPRPASSRAFYAAVALAAIIGIAGAVLVPALGLVGAGIAAIAAVREANK